MLNLTRSQSPILKWFFVPSKRSFWILTPFSAFLCFSFSDVISIISSSSKTTEDPSLLYLESILPLHLCPTRNYFQASFLAYLFSFETSFSFWHFSSSFVAFFFLTFSFSPFVFKRRNFFSSFSFSCCFLFSSCSSWSFCHARNVGFRRSFPVDRWCPQRLYDNVDRGTLNVWDAFSILQRFLTFNSLPHVVTRVIFLDFGFPLGSLLCNINDDFWH